MARCYILRPRPYHGRPEDHLDCFLDLRFTTSAIMELVLAFPDWKIWWITPWEAPATHQAPPADHDPRRLIVWIGPLQTVARIEIG